MPSSVAAARDIADLVAAQRDRTLALLEGLDAPRWETPVSSSWRVREVAAHLIASDESALTGRMLRLGLRQVSIDRLEAWNDDQVRRYADRPIPSLLQGLDRWGRRIVRALRIAGPLADSKLPTPLGKVSLRWLGGTRLYDEWVHLEDVRAALGLPSDDDREIVEPVARHLFELIPVQTFARIPAEARGAVTVRFTDLSDLAWGVDLSARRYGASLAGNGTVIDARAVPMIMIAAGRRPWRDAERDGDLTVTGDRAPAEMFLDALLAV